MILDLLRKRVSVRRFRADAVPDEALRDILEAGRPSPSGGNEQPWSFGVVTDRALIREIALTAHKQAWIASAPLVIVLCARLVGDDRGGRDIQAIRFPEYERAIRGMDQGLYWALNAEEHQTKIAGAHLALVALEHGVGSCWVSRFDVRALADLLHLPERVQPSEMLVMGYPAEDRAPRAKKALEEIVFYDAGETEQPAVEVPDQLVFHDTFARVVE